MMKKRTKNTKNNNEGMALEVDPIPPRFLPIVEGYLTGKHPMDRGNFNPRKMEVKTSQEIVLDLSEMADMELNDVAECMVWLGYRAIVLDHKVGWLIGHGDPCDEQ